MFYKALKTEILLNYTQKKSVPFLQRTQSSNTKNNQLITFRGKIELQCYNFTEYKYNLRAKFSVSEEEKKEFTVLSSYPQLPKEHNSVEGPSLRPLLSSQNLSVIKNKTSMVVAGIVVPGYNQSYGRKPP